MQNIIVVKEPALRLGSNSYHTLHKIMYDVVGIEKESVLEVDLTASMLDIVNADVIIAIGDKSLQYLCNLKGILKYAGTVQKYNGMPVVPIVSPGYLEHNVSYLKKFAEDIHTAYQVSLGLGKIEATNQYVLVQDRDTLTRLIKYIKYTGYCCFDFETTKLTDKMTFDPNFYCTSVSISFQQGSSYVIPLYHNENTVNDIDFIIDILNKEVFGNPDIVKVGHNIKFDMHCAAWCGVTSFRGPFHDTMLMHQLIDENLSHKLKDLVRSYYPRFANYEEAVGKDWASVPLSILARYNALDSDLTFRLYWLFTEMLINIDEELYLMYRNLTAPATKALFFMEENGMLIDKEKILEYTRLVDNDVETQEKRMRDHVEVKRYNNSVRITKRQEVIKDLEKKLAAAESTTRKGKSAQDNNEIKVKNLKAEIQDYKTGIKDVDFDINFSSPQQLKELLYSKEGFGFVLSKTSFGVKADSTGKENLDLIKDKSGFIEDLQAYRQLQKISSTYLTSIADKLDPHHRIHTNYNQGRAKTGRLSSDNPNLQNIISRTKFPIVEEAVSYVKKSFVPPKGYTLVQADYSQLELRLIAHFAKEKSMIDAFIHKQDIHELTAANSRGYGLDKFQLLKETDPKLYKQQRFEAKAENFGFCLHPDTIITTNRGEIPIKDVIIGDKVLTHKGRWEDVQNTQILQSDFLYEIKTISGKIIKCTPDHMWLCTFPQANGLPSMDGWMEAQDIRENMYLTYLFEEHAHGSLHIPENKALLLGWFLSEGHYGKGGIRISQSYTANKDVFDKMATYLSPLGFVHKDYPKYKSSFFYLKKSCGILISDYVNLNLKSKDKNFTDIVPLLDRETKLNILGALWDGDGCIMCRKRKSGNYLSQITYSSISIQLLTDIQICLHSFGINSKIYSYPNKRINVLHINGVKSRQRFISLIPTVKVDRNIHINDPSARLWSCEEKVMSVNKIEYNNLVYDITVKNDHSFIANNLISHNCYGISAVGFQEYARVQYGMNISLKEAERRRDAYYKRYPMLSDYYKLYIAKAQKFGYVKTFFGRRVHLPDIHSINGGVRGHAERNAINSPIQGTGGEMAIFAIGLLSNRLPKEILIVNTIHDSIMFYIPDAMVDEFVPVIKGTMENLPLMDYFGRTIDSVPIEVDFEYSKISWKDLAA